MKQEYFQHIDFFKNMLSSSRLEKIEKILEQRTRHITVVLEDSHKGHNISAVMRNIECFGVQDLHLIEDCNTDTTLSSYVSKSSDKWLSIYKHQNSAESSSRQACVKSLRDDNYQLVALSPHASTDSFENLDLNKKTALLMGKEISGLSEELIQASDHFIRLPMYGFSESFNLSVATALCLQNLVSKLKNSNVSWKLSESEKALLRDEWILKSIHKIHRYEKALGIA